MVTKLVLSLCLVFAVLIQASSANRYSRPNGTWSNTDGGADCGCTPGQNDVIIVNHNISLAGPFVVNNGSLTVNSPATLTVNGDLTFNNNSTVSIGLGGSLIVNGNFENKNNSDNVAFNGSISISGNFQNGTGGSGSAIIDFGPSATISIGGTCANAGVVNDTSGSYSGCGQGVLPIKLLFFDATLEGKIVVLRWATTLEENFDKFIIERSKTGINFHPIGEVEGAEKNTFETEIRYRLEDRMPILGFNYYRLKALDLDGSYEYFDVRVIKLEGDKQLLVYPNPSSGKSISFEINFSPSERDQILVVNNLGVELVRLPAYQTENNIQFPHELASGVYILKYISTNFQLSSRLMVNR